MKRSTISKLVAAALAIGVARGAEAAVSLKVTQIGGDVYTSASGTLNLTGLTYFLQEPGHGVAVRGSPAAFSIGDPGPVDIYTGLTGPSRIGTGGFNFTMVSSGTAFGFNNFGDLYLFFDPGYVSGAPISATAFYEGASLASMGVDPGRYVFTAPSDTITLDIGIGSVPEPGVWAMLLGGFGAIGATLRRRRSEVRAR